MIGRDVLEMFAIEVGDYVTNGRTLYQVVALDGAGMYCDDAASPLTELPKPLFVPASLFAHPNWRKVDAREV